MDIDNANSSAEPVILFLDNASGLLATNLLTTSGIPPTTIESKTEKKENAIWYTPTPSAPIVLDIKILNKKPSALSRTLKKVIINKELVIVFFMVNLYSFYLYVKTLTK